MGGYSAFMVTPPKMSKTGFARGSFENTNCATPKNWVVTEMLTKRIFAPKNTTLTIFGGWPARPNGGVILYRYYRTFFRRKGK